LKPTDDFSPIAEQGELELEAGLFSKLRRRREIAPVAPGFVRVLLDADSAPIEELTAGQKYWSRARGWVKVDVRSHSLEYTISFPDPSGLAGFVAVVDVTVAVSDANGAVAQAAESVGEILRPALQNAVRKAHSDSQGPDQEANPVAVLNSLRLAATRNVEKLIGPVAEMPPWLNAKVTSVTVELDEATAKHREELMGKIRAVALADADGQSEVAKAENELRVRKVWELGMGDQLAHPEKRALARIAADPSRENIDRVANELDQIEAQGRTAFVQVLREAIDKGHFPDDDEIRHALGALEQLFNKQQQVLEEAEPAKEVGVETDEHVVDAETVEAEAEPTPDAGSDSDEDGENRADTSWNE
jgi:hypothetical protein